MNKNYPVLCTTFVEVITQCSGSRERNTILAVFAIETHEICSKNQVCQPVTTLEPYIFHHAILTMETYDSPKLLKYMYLR